MTGSSQAWAGVDGDQVERLMLTDLVQTAQRREVKWGNLTPSVLSRHVAGEVQGFTFGDLPNDLGTDDLGDLPLHPDEFELKATDDPGELISAQLQEALAAEQPGNTEPRSLWEKFRAAALQELCAPEGVICQLFHTGTPVVVKELVGAVKTVLGKATAAGVGAALAGLHIGPVVVAVLALLIMKIGLDMACMGYTTVPAHT